ncbi:YdgA family protein [Ottowia sp.]|uniref:YdgA family protein n=1 Tax=Ottowia sp. TaxID=1898956 RepID=UPI003A8A3D9A
MSRKTSKIAAAIAVLGVAYTGANWWLGQQVEARYAALKDKAVAQFGEDVFVERQYERGLFSSKSTVVVQLDWPSASSQRAALNQGAAENDAEQEELDADQGTQSNESALPLPGSPAGTSADAPQKIRLTFQDDIRHGPLPGLALGAARIHTRLTKVEGADEATRQAFAKVKPPEFDTLAGFDGTYSGQARLPAGEVADPQTPDNAMQWQALVYDYQYNADASHVEGSMHWPQVSLRIGDALSDDDEGAMTLRIDGLKADFDVTQAGERWFLSPGHGSGTVDALVLSYRSAGQPDLKPVLDLKKLAFDSKATSQDGLMSQTDTLTGEGSLGGLALKEVRVESQLQRVSEAGLMAAQKLLTKVQSAQQGQTAEQAMPPEEEVADMMGHLLKGQPEYRFSLKASAADGQAAQLGYHVAVGEGPEGADEQPWMGRLQQSLRADADVRLPKAWLPALADLAHNPEVTPEAMTELAQTLARQGLVIEDGDAYMAKAEYGSGRLSLNGQPLFGGMGR